MQLDFFLSSDANWLEKECSEFIARVAKINISIFGMTMIQEKKWTVFYAPIFGINGTVAAACPFSSKQSWVHLNEVLILLKNDESDTVCFTFGQCGFNAGRKGSIR